MTPPVSRFGSRSDGDPGSGSELQQTDDAEPNKSNITFMRGWDPGFGSQSLALKGRLSWICHQGEEPTRQNAQRGLSFAAILFALRCASI